MSKWRQRHPVHPAADVFHMMEDEELAGLGEDIRKRGLQQPIIFYVPPGTTVNPSSPTDGCILIDGRNRLEAMERAGIDVVPHTKLLHKGDPARIIISLNIKRRHLTKQQQADLIVTAVRADKPRQVGEVSSKGGRGNIDEAKAEAVVTAEEHDISKRTVERAYAKVEGRQSRIHKPRPPTNVDLKLARERYAAEYAKLPVREEAAEMERLFAAVNRARGGQ